MTSSIPSQVSARLRLLVVEDDPAISQIYREVLEQEGFDVVTAASCAEAMSRMDELKGAADLLLIDLGLPDGDGADFARDSAAKFGPRPILYVSGWADEFWQLDQIPGRWFILRKPVAVPQLLAGIRWLARGGEKPAELNGPA